MRNATFHPLEFKISGDSLPCERARAHGFATFDALAAHVRSLPYRRIADHEDPCAVLREGRGTCSSKHRLLATVAQDCGHPEIGLTLGVYEMSEANTPGVGPPLAAAGVVSIPEAHCYLTLGRRRLDFTGLASGSASPFDALLAEYPVSPSELPEAKPRVHLQAIASWATVHGMSTELAWAVREACIAALAAGACGERED